MTNFDLWKILNFVVGKDVYANSIAAPEMELELQSKNMRLFRKRLGFPESYRPGQPVQAIDATRLTQTDLKPFYVEASVNIKDGVAELPDWFYIEDYYSDVSRTAELISRQEVSNRIRDAQTKPTEKDMAAYITAAGLVVYPSTVTKITALYIRKPSEPAFKILTDATTLEPIYDTANSNELEWDDMGKLDILHLIMSDMGIRIERADVTGYAEQLIKTGD